MRRRPTGDTGASLVLALVFLTVVSVGAAALLTLAETGQLTTSIIRSQAKQLYSADGAMDRAITVVRENPTLGLASPANCPTTSTTLNGVATEVTCVAAPGSGAATGGSATNANLPKNAVLTMASGAERGLVQESNNELRIKGPVVSNSTVEVNVASASLAVDGSVSARGACTGNITSTAPPIVCNQGAAVIANSSDPDYPMHPGAGAVPPTAAPPPQGCPVAGGARYVRFFPGKYSSASDLNAVFTRCAGGVFHFTSGFYYFEFDPASPLWSITGSGTRVVGGEAASNRWTPNNPSPGDLGVIVPFPVDPVPATPTTPEVLEVKGACVTSEEVATTPGVQFAFGATSRMRVQDAAVELCARGSTTEQHIALYGLPPLRDTTQPPPPAPTPTTVTRTSAGPATATGTPLYTNPDGARVKNGDVASVVGTESGNGSVATLTMPALKGTAVPAGATVDRVQLRIVHQPVNSDVTKLQAQVTTSSGTTVTVGDATGMCTAATTTQICRNPTTTPYEQLVTVPGAFTLADVNSDLDLRFQATVKKGQNTPGGEHRVDALELVVTYTPAPVVVPDAYEKLTGCLTVPLEAGGCPLVETIGGPTSLTLHGTLYAPTAAVQLELTNVASQVLRRGIVVRTARVKVTGSSAFLGSPIQLPPLSGVPGNRKVVFTARQVLTSGQPAQPVLRAVVAFDDTGTIAPTKPAEVKSWSVLR